MNITIINPTPKNIRALKCPPNKKQRYARISKDLHLYVSITPNGSKSLVYRRYLNNTYREQHLTKFADSLDDAMARETIKIAEGKAAALRAKLERGENPFDLATTARKEATLQELFIAYMDGHIKKKRKTVNDTEKNFKRWFSKMANRKALSITRNDVEKLHESMEGKYAANRAVQLGRAIFNKAILWGRFHGQNPFSNISLNDEQPRDRFLSPEEAGRLIKALNDISDDHDGLRALRDLVFLSLLTGARKSNLLAMAWEEIDWQRATWTIPKHKTKTKQDYLISLGGTEIAILKNRQELLKDEALKVNSLPSRFVFPGPGKTGHIVDNKRSWTTLRRQTGLSDITLHDLRRSLAATMASQNVNLALIKGALHHRDMKTTLRVYAKTNKEAELQAKQLAHSVWFEAASKPSMPLDIGDQEKKQRA